MTDDTQTIAELREELAKYKRGAKTLGETIEKQCQMVLDASGRHDLIAEDGDGDWGAVWDHLSALRPRAEAAEAKLAKVRAYAKEREAQGRYGRTVHSARIASDLLAIVDDTESRK